MHDSPPTERDPAENTLPAWLRLVDRPGSVVGLVALIALARVVYMAWFSPYTLAEDEAHYWEWARRLDWSYYSKGPGVAWVIALSTALFGQVEWAVRLPAVLAGAVGSLAAAGLARDLFGTRAHGFVAALIYQCVPAFAVTSVLMTIDAPYLACWAVAVWAGHRALVAGGTGAWAWLGLAVALGFLFKYTILLLLPGLVGFALLHRSRLRIDRRGIALSAGLALLGLLPVAIWNAQNDWPTVRHLIGHLGLPGGDVQPTHGNGWTYSPLWTLGYLGLHVATGGPMLLLAIFGLINLRKQGRLEPGDRLMVWAAGPILLFYLAMTALAETEGNWPIAGYVSLVPLASWAALDALGRGDRPVRWTWGATLAIGAAVVVAPPLLPLAVTREPGQALIPLHRATGMRQHAAAVAARLDRIEAETGFRPFVMAWHYGRASQLAFYLPDRPVVYCIASITGGRKNQYDYWPDTDLRRPDVARALAGRPALLLGGSRGHWAPAFDAVEDIGKLDAEPKRDWTTWVGYGYRGFHDVVDPWAEAVPAEGASLDPQRRDPGGTSPPATDQTPAHAPEGHP